MLGCRGGLARDDGELKVHRVEQVLKCATNHCFFSMPPRNVAYQTLQLRVPEITTGVRCRDSSTFFLNHRTYKYKYIYIHINRHIYIYIYIDIYIYIRTCLSCRASTYRTSSCHHFRKNGMGDTFAKRSSMTKAKPADSICLSTQEGALQSKPALHHPGRT